MCLQFFFFAFLSIFSKSILHWKDRKGQRPLSMLRPFCVYVYGEVKEREPTLYLCPFIKCHYWETHHTRRYGCVFSLALWPASAYNRFLFFSRLYYWPLFRLQWIGGFLLYNHSIITRLFNGPFLQVLYNLVGFISKKGQKEIRKKNKKIERIDWLMLHMAKLIFVFIFLCHLLVMAFPLFLSRVIFIVASFPFVCLPY